MKAVIGILKVIGYFVLFLTLAIFESIKYLFCGQKIIGKVAIIACYLGLAASALFNTNIFLAIIGIIAILDMIFSIHCASSSENKKSRTQNNGDNNAYSNANTRYTLFEGMTLEDAKREYRRLMKIYHPDNQNGDLSMSQRINNEYREYCATYAK